MGEIKKIEATKPYTVSTPVRVTTDLGDGVSKASSRVVTRGDSKVTVTIFEAKASQAGNSGNDAVRIDGDSAAFKLSEILDVIGDVKQETRFSNDKYSKGLKEFAEERQTDGTVSKYFIKSGTRYNLGALMTAGGRSLTDNEPKSDTDTSAPANTDTSAQAAPALEQQQQAGGQQMPAQQNMTDPGRVDRNIAEASGHIFAETAGTGSGLSFGSSPAYFSVDSIVADYNNTWNRPFDLGALFGAAASGAQGGAGAADTANASAADSNKAVEDTEGPSLVIGNPPEETKEAEAKKKDEVPKEIGKILENMYKALNTERHWYSYAMEDAMKDAIAQFTGDNDSKLDDVIKYWEKSQYATALNPKNDGKPISLIDAIIEKTNSCTEQYKDYLAPIAEGLVKNSNSTKAQEIKVIFAANAEKTASSTEAFNADRANFKAKMLELTQLSAEGVKAKKAEEEKEAKKQAATNQANKDKKKAENEAADAKAITDAGEEAVKTAKAAGKKGKKELDKIRKEAEQAKKIKLQEEKNNKELEEAEANEKADGTPAPASPAAPAAPAKRIWGVAKGKESKLLSALLPKDED